MKADILRAMLAAGCTADQIVAAAENVERTEAEKKEAKRIANAERQRRFRDRNKSNASNALHGVTERDTPSSDKEKSPTPPKEINSIPETSLRSEQKKATRLTAEWQPDLAFAADQGFSQSEAMNEAMKFRDYWISKPGKDGTKLDWPATWRYWIRNASSRRPARSSSRPESEFAKHQRECTEALERSVYGEKRNEQFASNGATLDLEPGNWRPH